MFVQVKMVAEPALSLMLADLEECDKFARSDPVPGIDKFILLLIFQELRQLLELVKKDDWNVFFANYGKPSGKCLYVVTRRRPPPTPVSPRPHPTP